MSLPGMRSAAAIALLFVSGAFGIFGLPWQKTDNNPHNPHKRELPGKPPQLLPQCAPTVLMYNETRSIVRGLLRHKARRRSRALWYFNMRFAAQPENDSAAIMRFMARAATTKR